MQLLKLQYLEHLTQAITGNYKNHTTGGGRDWGGGKNFERVYKMMMGVAFKKKYKKGVNEIFHLTSYCKNCYLLG